MKIALVTHQWPGVRLGGIGAYTVHCARGLAEAGHEPHVFTFSIPSEARRIVAAGVRLHEVPDLAQRVREGSLAADLAAAAQGRGEAAYRLVMGSLLCDAVRGEHGRGAFDVVEGPEYEGLLLPLVLRPLEGEGGALIAQFQSGSAIARLSGNPASAASESQALLEAMEWEMIQGVDAIGAGSRQVVRDTATGYGVERLREDEPAILAAPFYDESAYCEPPVDGGVLYVGRLERLKGCHLLAIAAREFLARDPKATLRLIGPDTATAEGMGGGGASMAAWMKRQIPAELAGRVAFLGEQGRERIRRELEECAFVVLPSLFDNFPNVALEAMAAGRAVVVSDGIGGAELVAEGGIRFARGDAGALAAAMERLWRDRELQVSLGRAGNLRLRGELAAEKVIRARVDFYERVIGQRRRVGRRKVGERIGHLAAGDTGEFLAKLASEAELVKGMAGGRVLTPGMRLLAVMERHARACGAAGARILLYGAGRHTSRLLAEKAVWEAKGHRVVGLIDDHPRFAEAGGGEHLGLPVESCRSAAERLTAHGGVAVVLSTDTFEDQFWEQARAIRERGIAVYRLYGAAGSS